MHQHPVCSDLLSNHLTHLFPPMHHSALLSNHTRKCPPRLVRRRTFINKEDMQEHPLLWASLTILVTAVSLSHLHHQCLTPTQILATSLLGMPLLRLAHREFQTTLE